MAVDIEKLNSVLDKYQGEQGMLIQVLLEIQQKFNWIPPEAMKGINQKLGIPLAKIHRVASFYKAMSLQPRGEHWVRICLGTACHVRGGMKIMDRAQDVLGVKEGGTTGDRKFTLERVMCLGCCALGPVMVVDDVYNGNLEASRVEEVLKNYK